MTLRSRTQIVQTSWIHFLHGTMHRGRVLGLMTNLKNVTGVAESFQLYDNQDVKDIKRKGSQKYI